MLYFSKIRIILIVTFTTIFVYIFLSNFIKFDGGALDIASQKLEINANNFEVSSQQASMSLGEGKVILQGTGTPKLAIGPSAKDFPKMVSPILGIRSARYAVSATKTPKTTTCPIIYPSSGPMTPFRNAKHP